MNSIKYFLYIILISLILISCEEEKNQTLIVICAKPSDCSENEDCKFNDIESIEGVCVKKLECNYSYECDNNRDCVEEASIKTCGRTGEFNIFTETKNLDKIYINQEYKFKIILRNPQGEFYFRLIEGSLPNGITLSENGVLSGITDDKLGIYNFTIEAINAPMESNTFFNYIKTTKNLELNLEDNDPCHYNCNKFQVCNIETSLCENTEIPENMVRIYSNNEVYQGLLIAEWNHNLWWWENEDKYTYALFDKEKFINDQNTSDNSIKILADSEIEYIETSSTYLNTQKYDDFLIENNMTFSLPLEGVNFIAQANGGYHLEEDGYGDFAYDFVKVDENDNSYSNTGDLNSDYYVWNQNIYLPIEGEVFEIKDNNEDNETPHEYVDKSESNFLGIKLKGNYYLYLLHFKKDSMPLSENFNCNTENLENSDLPECIELGKTLKAGSFIGKVGNSGVSLVPHLHITMFWYSINNDEIRMWSIPSIFKNIKILDEENYDFYKPKTGDKLEILDK